MKVTPEKPTALNFFFFFLHERMCVCEREKVTTQERDFCNSGGEVTNIFYLILNYALLCLTLSRSSHPHPHPCVDIVSMARLKC